MSATERIKITKSDFERMLWKKYAGNQLTKQHFDERTGFDEYDNPVYARLTLYYSDDVHCATWMNGEGWEFARQSTH